MPQITCTRRRCAHARQKPHSTEFRGRACHRISKASGGEDLQIEEPVCCGDASAFDFYATLANALGPTLIRDETGRTYSAVLWMSNSLAPFSWQMPSQRHHRAGEQ